MNKYINPLSSLGQRSATTSELERYGAQHATQQQQLANIPSPMPTPLVTATILNTSGGLNEAMENLVSRLEIIARRLISELPKRGPMPVSSSTQTATLPDTATANEAVPPFSESIMFRLQCLEERISYCRDIVRVLESF